MSSAPSPEYVIVIGASVGGLRAIREIARALPANFPAPIFFVQHIGAYPSHLPELVSAVGQNRAVSASEGELPVPGTIYIAPSDMHMLLEADGIRLTRGPKENHARPAIDPLFRSAALTYGPAVIGVVLTGMLDDGSAGLAAIKSCGGIAVVQDPREAEAPDMPMNALASADVDHIAPLAAIPSLLHRLVQQPRTNPPVQRPDGLASEHAASFGDQTMQTLQQIGEASTFTCPDCGGVLFELNDKRPVRFRCHTGHAFSLRSLAHTQKELTDAALWSGLRALQEKESMLRRIANSLPSSGHEESAKALQQAREISDVSSALRNLITDSTS